jgi:hypothetical protein
MLSSGKPAGPRRPSGIAPSAPRHRQRAAAPASASSKATAWPEYGTGAAIDPRRRLAGRALQRLEARGKCDATGVRARHTTRPRAVAAGWTEPEKLGADPRGTGERGARWRGVLGRAQASGGRGCPLGWYWELCGKGWVGETPRGYCGDVRRTQARTDNNCTCAATHSVLAWRATRRAAARKAAWRRVGRSLVAPRRSDRGRL